MSENFSHLVFVIFFWIVAPIVLCFASFCFLRKGNKISKLKRRIWAVVGVLSSLPLIFILLVLFWFVAANFPFTSGIVAQASAPTGEQVCVVQTFKGAEPYQVSLYVRAPGGLWVWHYLAHQDTRWRDCRIEFDGGELRVYEGTTLRTRLSLADATKLPKDPREQLPSSFTPEQILQRHNAMFRN